MSTTDPTITVIAIAYNEERLMPFFLNYYSKFCDHIVIYDNYSTDRTEEICKSFNGCKVTVIKYETKDTLDDETYLKIKNNVYRDFSTDYCIVVDLDEFLYHDNLKKFLIANKDVKVFKPQGYNMVSTVFPVGDDITVIKSGVPEINYCKL
jgi:glycosyltransferase involved in cell wall biosynthesis